jgi:hypothetical protein
MLPFGFSLVALFGICLQTCRAATPASAAKKRLAERRLQRVPRELLSSGSLETRKRIGSRAGMRRTWRIRPKDSAGNPPTSFCY